MDVLTPSLDPFAPQTMRFFEPPQDEVTAQFQEFERLNGDRTPFGGAASWANNLLSVAEHGYYGAKNALLGTMDEPYHWGCSEATAELSSYMRERGHTPETLTSRNRLGMQHNQIVVGGRVLDSWAGEQQEIPESPDQTLIPFGQAVEMAIQGNVDPTGVSKHAKHEGLSKLFDYLF